MTRVGRLAVSLNYYPEWFNAYNKVHITMRADTLTMRDIKLANFIDNVVERRYSV